MLTISSKRSQRNNLLVVILHLGFLFVFQENIAVHALAKEKLVILGLGRVGLDCARSALSSFDKVIGTVRSSASTPNSVLVDDGIIRIPLSSIHEELIDASHILWTIPLPKEKDANLEILLNYIGQEEESQSNQWVGMVSTSGVYGNHDGAWVTEDSPLLCTQESNAYLYPPVEERFLSRKNGRVFRCAGIYDSSRSALHTVYKMGYRSEKKINVSESPTNRIHSTDIAKAIVVSMDQASGTSRIYNLADNEPAPRSAVLSYSADLLESIGVDLKKRNKIQKDKSLTTRERRRKTDRKLVSNQRMKDELLEVLTYPTYHEGLNAILKEPNTPWNCE